MRTGCAQESGRAAMSDVFDHDKRSDVMSRIRGRGNATTELAMLSMLREARITGWRRHVELRPKPAAGAERLRKTKSGRIRVRPDFTFRTQKVAVFVDGCFWHGCPIHCLQPKQNVSISAHRGRHFRLIVDAVSA